MPWLFFFAGLAIPAFYAVGLLARTETPPHGRRVLAVLGRPPVGRGLPRAVHHGDGGLHLRAARRGARDGSPSAVIFLDVILYSVGGVIGTMHHLYFSGTPVEHMALGAFFSAAEVIPLTFLTVEAWSVPAARARARSRGRSAPFPHRWAVMFLVAVGFWNFLGAGIFGFLINLPIVSYYEIGTALTANHAHARDDGRLRDAGRRPGAVRLRYLIPADRWPEQLAQALASGR